jgi:hypothetical protein
MSAKKHFWALHPSVYAVGSAVGISSATAACACRYIASKNGTIESVSFRTGPMGPGVSPVYSIGFETLNATTGNPSGTLIAGTARETFTCEPETYYTINFTSPPTVTLGQAYAVIIRYSSGTISGSIYRQFLRGTGATFGFMTNNSFPGSVFTSNGTTWSVGSAQLPSLCPRYDDGELERFCGIIKASDYTQMGFQIGGSNPKYGTRFTCPVNATLHGAVITRTMSTSASFHLLDLDDNVLSSSPALPVANGGAQYAGSMTPYEMQEGQEYRIILQAEVLEFLNPQIFEAQNAELNANIHGDACLTYLASGAWVDSNIHIPPVVPLIGGPSSVGVGSAGFPMSRILNRV